MQEGAELKRRLDQLTHEIIGAAIKIHKVLGPGLLESAYSVFMAIEMMRRWIRFEQEKGMPVVYEGIRVDLGYRMDFFVEKLVALELKAVEQVHPVHKLKLTPYLRLSGAKVGLLINFHVPVLTRGIVRIVNGYPG